MKCCCIIPCSSGFIPGLTAIINSFYLYGTKADIHVLWYGAMDRKEDEAFFSQARSLGTVTFIPVQDAFHGYPMLADPIWLLWSSRWVYPQKLDYDVVSYLDADSLVLDDLTPAYTLAYKSGQLVTCVNAVATQDFVSKWDGTIYQTNDTPYRNHPSFMRLDKYKDTLYDIYKITYDYALSDFPAFSFALMRKNITPFILPDSLWTKQRFDFDPMVAVSMEPPLVYSGTECQRIKVIHGKWFSWGHVQHNLLIADRDSAQPEVYKANLLLCYNLYKYLTAKGPIVLDWRDPYD